MRPIFKRNKADDILSAFQGHVRFTRMLNITSPMTAYCPNINWKCFHVQAWTTAYMQWSMVQAEQHPADKEN